MAAESDDSKKGNPEPELVFRPPRIRRYTPETKLPGISAGAANIELDVNGFITVWSKQAEQIYGYGADEIMGKHMASLFCESELEQARAAYQLYAIRNRKSYNVHGWQRRKSGQQFWTYTQGVRIEFGCRLLVEETAQIEKDPK